MWQNEISAGLVDVEHRLATPPTEPDTEPAAPLTIWPCHLANTAPRADGESDWPILRPMSVPLAARIVAEFTTSGDLVVAADRQPESVLLAAAWLGRRAVGFASSRAETVKVLDRVDSRCSPEQAARITVRTGSFDRLSGLDAATGLSGGVRLVVALAVDEGGSPGQPSQSLYFVSARLLADGGLLAVHTASRPALADGAMTYRHAQIVADARAAGLTYLQHIVVLHAPIQRGRLQPPHRAGAGTQPSQSVQHLHEVVHSDLLVFTLPAEEPQVPDA